MQFSLRSVVISTLVSLVGGLCSMEDRTGPPKLDRWPVAATAPRPREVGQKDQKDPKPEPKPVATPTITGAESSSFMAVFTIEGAKDGDLIFWSVTPEDGVEIYEDQNASLLAFGGPPGQYKVKAVGSFSGKKFSISKSTTLTGVGKGPVPNPQPGPGPNPKPQPNPTPAPVGASRFVVVEDTSAVGTWRGSILGSPKVKSFYESLQGTRTGAIHAIYDSSTAIANLSAEGQKYVGLAAGKTLPYIWVLDSSGAVLKEQSVPKDPDAFIALFDTHVGVRSFGLIIEAPKLKWTEFGSKTNVPIIPRDQWPAWQTLASFLPPVYDQDGIGQCASSAATALLEFSRKLDGLPPVHFSAGDLYSRVCGGRDNGSTLEDNMAELLNNGVNPVSSSIPYVWNRRISYPAAGRSPYKFAEVYLCKDFDSAVSAILQGMPVQIGISWQQNYNPNKQTGWLPKKGSGSVGGHSLFSYGVAKMADGTWGLITRNSWSATWGGSSDGSVDAGSCIIPESAFTGYIGGFYAVRSTVSKTSRRKFGELDLALAF